MKVESEPSLGLRNIFIKLEFQSLHFRASDNFPLGYTAMGYFALFGLVSYEKITRAVKPEPRLFTTYDVDHWATSSWVIAEGSFKASFLRTDPRLPSYLDLV